MVDKSLFMLIFLYLLRYGQTQSSTISVGPLLECSITTFACSGTDGCCTIGGCCGTGCCANGYTCINEGTSDEACCPASDPTVCGTVSTPTDSDPGSGGGTCTGIDNCPVDPDVGLSWTCLLGQTCGFSYRDCNPCPYIGTGSETTTYDSSPTETAASPSSTISDYSDSATTSASTSDSTNTPESSGHRLTNLNPLAYWLLVAGLGHIVVGVPGA